MLNNVPALLTALKRMVGKLITKLDSKLDKTAAAISAARLTNPFTLSLNGDAVGSASVLGNANVAITVALKDSGATAGNYGDVLTVPVLTVDAKGRITAINGVAVRSASTTQSGVVQLSSATNSTSAVLAATPAAVKAAYDLAATKLDSGANAASATKLQTSRSISTTGDGTWTVNFDGSADVTAAFGLSATGVVAGSYAKVTVDAKGRVTAGAALVASDVPTLNQNTTGSAATLTTSRSISATGDATWTVSFNGSANVTAALTLAATGVTAGVYTKVTVDAKGRVTAGAALSAADVPTLNQDTTGNAATATAWKTARTLSYTGDATGSASLDGSANVAFALTLAASGVTAGTYAKVTVDAKGRVTAGAALAAADIPALDTSKLTTGVLPLARGGTAGYNIAARNIFISTADPSGGADGDIWLKYV